MMNQLSDLAESAGHDAIGRLIAYGGGGAGVALTKLAEMADGTLIYAWGYWMFGAAVLGRVVLDAYRIIKDKKSGKDKK